eukprot:340117-Chlamydomonas_euryale.AAC.2
MAERGVWGVRGWGVGVSLRKHSWDERNLHASSATTARWAGQQVSLGNMCGVWNGERVCGVEGGTCVGWETGNMCAVWKGEHVCGVEGRTCVGCGTGN